MNITCQLLGGVGNMLFAIATTYNLSKEHNLNQVLHLDHRGYLHTTPKDYLNTIFRNIPVVNEINNYTLVTENSFTYSPIKIPVNKHIKLSGYFQSEKYFINVRSELLNLFSPTGEILSEIYQKYGTLFKKPTVSLHIRRGNYVKLFKKHPPVSIEYCNEALLQFPNHNVLIFSDDIEYCKQNFKGPNFYFIENNKDIIDLYMMSLCNHNIIANSTFSWWGAWLSKNESKTVIAPSKWFGVNNLHHNLKDLFPETWKVI